MPHAAPAGSLERLRCGLLWLTGLSGAFVFVEPSPYEAVALLTIAVFAVTGLRLSAPLMPLAALLVTLNLGFTVALVPVLGEPRTLQWVLVSWYLAATALFFAAMLGENTEARLDALLRGTVLAALVASLAGIAGYFGLVPGFTRFGRAQGTFNDPNVFGAFLILPALVALHRMLTGRMVELLWAGLCLGVILVGILLSFSRAAWGQFALCAVLLMALAFVTSGSRRERLRIVLIAVAAAAALAAMVAVVLSLDTVAALFQERASLVQGYDTGPTGRFGRYVSGMLMALDHPAGIGPLQFSKHFPEDPHNSYLNTFITGGWASGLAYAALVLVTLGAGLRYAFVASPWRGLYLAVFAAFAGVAAESLIIDTDHWRHYFLLLGVQWGLIAATARHRRTRRAAAALAAAPPHPHTGLAPAGAAA